MNPANFPTVTGMVDIPCMDSPEVLQRPDLTDELDTVQMTLARRTRHVLLDGLYAVLQSDIATINGTVYDVLAVEPDSQRVTTRLAVQVRVI